MSPKHCPECKETLVCPGHGVVQRPLVSACNHKRGGLWVLVRDGSGLEVSGIPVEVDGKSATTDATGLAGFDPLDDGSYCAKLGALPRSIRARFDPPTEPMVRDIAVSRGKVTFAELVLRRRPTVKVELSHAVAATVTLTCNDGDGDSITETTKDGVVEFGPVEAGAHTVGVELRGEPGTGNQQIEGTDVTVDHGEDVVVTVEVPQRVDPVIEAERDALAVRGHRLAVVLGATGPFHGRGRLRIIEGAQSIRVWRGKQEQRLGGDGLVLDLDGGSVTIELEARTASTKEGVQLQWELLGDGVGEAVSKRLTAVEAILVMHDAQQRPIDRETAREHARVLVKCEADNRRAKVTVRCEPADYEGTMLLNARDDSRNLRLYDSATGAGRVVLPRRLSLPLEQPPELYVEGHAPSANKGGDALDLGIQDLGDELDTAVVTVVEASLEVCGPAPAEGEPEPLSDEDKLDPGRALFEQGWDFASPRALVRVRKNPVDAPCTLQLVASGNEVRLLSTEEHAENEVPQALPRSIAANEITNVDAGLELWAEGAVETAAGERTTWRLDVEQMAEGLDEIGFTVGRATVEIEVTRQDTAALSGPVQVELRDEPGGTVLFEETLVATDGKVELQVPPASYVVGLAASTGSDEEAFRLLREPVAVEAADTEPADPEAAAASEAAAETQSREASVRIEPGETTRVRYTYAPKYDRIQLVAYQIRTGDYLGQDDVDEADYADADALAAAREQAAKGDIDARCNLMKEAIVHAAAEGDIEDSPDTLKVFMAPEFYFRGSRGAYPIELLSRISEQMRKETDKPKYADWMFVFGSAIGRVKESERVEHDGTDVELKKSSAIFSFKCAKKSVLMGIKAGWQVRLASKTAEFTSPSTWSKVGTTPTEYGIVTVTSVSMVEVSSKSVEVTIICKDVPEFSPKDFKLVAQIPGQAKGRKIPKPKVVDCWASLVLNCVHPPEPGWSIEHEGRHLGTITEVVPMEGQDYGLLIDRLPHACPTTGIDVKVVAPPRAEIFNVSFVQQGGPGSPMRTDGSRELRELLVYKEYISSIDFQGDDYNKRQFGDPSRHRGEIDGDRKILLVPTAGSTDVLGAYPNRPGQPRKKPPLPTDPNTDGTGTASESTKNGLGGGSVFTMHDITFGLEVCVDHDARRLQKYYGGAGEPGTAQPGERKVQVQLIPSCGMEIRHPCCVGDGLVFNVDRSHDAARAAGGTEVLEPIAASVPPVPATVALTDYFYEAGNVRIYEPKPTPTSAVV